MKDYRYSSKDTWAVYNLNGKYNFIDCVIGHVDSSDLGDDTVLQIMCDGQLKKEIPLQADMQPKNITIDVKGVNQLKLILLDGGCATYGLGNPVIK